MRSLVEARVREIDCTPVLPALIRSTLQAQQRELARAWPYPCALWTADTQRDARRWLSSLLAQLTNQLVVEVFTAYRLTMQPLWRPQRRPPGPARADAPTHVSRAFAEADYARCLFTASRAFPALQDVVTTVCENWRHSTIELLRRAAGCSDELDARFGAGETGLGALTEIRFGQSDAHDQGRTVARLIYEHGAVVYKPRTLGGEAVWGEVLDQVLPAALGLESRQPELLCRPGYGFCEYVPHRSCTSLEQVQRCYMRYGAILAVAHALGTTDLHHENIIVDGEHPVVVDAEALLPGTLAPSDRVSTLLDAQFDVGSTGLHTRMSVWELGLLPVRTSLLMSPDGDDPTHVEVGFGALCADGLQGLVRPVACATDSDDLAWGTFEVTVDTFPNLPQLGGELQRPQAYLKDIKSGFSRTHRYLRTHKAEIAALIGRHTADLLLRVIPRPTFEYDVILKRSLSAGALRSAAGRQRTLMRDLRADMRGQLDARGGLADAEVRSLMAGDIPRFEVAADAQSVSASQLARSPAAGFNDRLRSLDERDCELQITTIDLSVMADSAGIPPAGQTPDLAPARTKAESILEVVASAARRTSPDGTWVFLTQWSSMGGVRVHCDREALFDGIAGTALALAEGGALLGRGDWSELAGSAFEPILRGSRLESLRRGGGLARGLGGLAYAMSRTGRAIGREDLVDFAVNLLDEHGVALARGMNDNDLLNGRAGLMAVTLALSADRPSAGLTAVADALALELKRRACRSASGTWWPSGDDAGFHPHMAHGSTGIAYALARYASFRSDEQSRDLVVDALAWDDQYHRAEADPDAPTLGDGDIGWSWCRGRSGSIAARVIIDALLDLRVSEDIETAVAADPNGPLKHPSPGLCCGTGGVLDALIGLQADGGWTGLSAKTALAVDLLTTREASVKVHPLFCSLFNGCAGHAFALLRSLSPERIPSIVLVE